MKPTKFANPFRPGAGHMPPYLAGRKHEIQEFLRLLEQDVIMENLILTGLRGTGKTVLLDTLKPVAAQERWLWVGTDLSESTSINEDNLATRIMVDLAVVTSRIEIEQDRINDFGFVPETYREIHHLGYETLKRVYDNTPGLVSDKLKTVLELVWVYLKGDQSRGLIFAYDEAQNLSDRHSAKDEYPLSLMLDVFQSIQKKKIPFMLALTGLPTLFPKLVEARTFAERMFHVVTLDSLNETDSRDAILKPIEETKCPIGLYEKEIKSIIELSGGYPYFIQFVGKEVFDVLIQKIKNNKKLTIPFRDITRKLDTDFFSGRWARATDRQRELLTVIAHLETCDEEFTVQEVASLSQKSLKSPFSPSHISQMLANLINVGLVYKNRHGKYSFAVPMLGRFILRQGESV